jgi:hypothetical protein
MIEDQPRGAVLFVDVWNSHGGARFLRGDLITR